jgi:hypothetical protein
MPAGSLVPALEASKQIGGIWWTVMAAGAGEAANGNLGRDP